MTKSLLLIEDDSGIRKFLKELLSDNGFSVREAADGTDAMNSLTKILPDLMILDLGLPNMSGESVCAEVKKKYPSLPILILSAKDSTANIVQGLNLGADDYMTKPFVADELVARIRARLRDIGGGEEMLQVGDLNLNPKTMEVKRGSKLLTLTAQEYKLLHYLMSNPGRVLTREMILNRVWQYSPDIESRVVDIYIGYLRKKIDATSKVKLIKSIRGFGYTIKAE